MIVWGKIKDHLAYIRTLASASVVITDDKVKALYADEFKDLKGHVFSFPHGEQSKTRETKEKLENQLFEHGLGKDTCIVALGGGVVTDMAGYIAATFCRGLPLVMVPTSLLAIVDASIGGKNGVNVPYGKNMLGCIYQPKKIIIDLDTLKTLSKREMANGWVEMIKHGLIDRSDYFEALERGIALKEAVLKSCQIKQKIVKEDQVQKGRRDLLNFGHTVGHALEHVTGYALSHGEAVAIGILVEGYLAVQLKTIPPEFLFRMKRCLEQYGLPLEVPEVPVDAIFQTMERDKKTVNGQIRFVIIGDEPECVPVERALVEQALQWMKDDLCRH